MRFVFRRFFDEFGSFHVYLDRYRFFLSKFNFTYAFLRMKAFITRTIFSLRKLHLIRMNGNILKGRNFKRRYVLRIQISWLDILIVRINWHRWKMEKFWLKVKPIIINGFFVNFESYSTVSIGSSISVREHVRFEGYPLCIHIANEIKAYYPCGAIFEHNRNDSV